MRCHEWKKKVAQVAHIQGKGAHLPNKIGVSHAHPSQSMNPAGDQNSLFSERKDSVLRFCI